MLDGSRQQGPFFGTCLLRHVASHDPETTRFIGLLGDTRSRVSRTRGKRHRSAGRSGCELLALLVLIGLASAAVVVYWPRPRPVTAIARAADKAKPEIAVLLREINDVALDLMAAYPESRGSVRCHGPPALPLRRIAGGGQLLEPGPGTEPAVLSRLPFDRAALPGSGRTREVGGVFPQGPGVGTRFAGLLRRTGAGIAGQRQGRGRHRCPAERI